MARSEGKMYDLTRLLDVEATASALEKKAEECMSKVTDFVGELHEGDAYKWRHALEWDLGVSIANRWLAESYTSLALGIRNSEGTESGQEQHEHAAGDEEDGRVFEERVTHRHISPEEHVDSAMAYALELVLRSATNPWSRSTGTSSNFVEDMEAGAAIEFLETLGWDHLHGAYMAYRVLVAKDQA